MVTIYYSDVSTLYGHSVIPILWLQHNYFIILSDKIILQSSCPFVSVYTAVNKHQERNELGRSLDRVIKDKELSME